MTVVAEVEEGVYDSNAERENVRTAEERQENLRGECQPSLITTQHIDLLSA